MNTKYCCDIKLQTNVQKFTIIRYFLDNPPWASCHWDIWSRPTDTNARRHSPPLYKQGTAISNNENKQLWTELNNISAENHWYDNKCN